MESESLLVTRGLSQPPISAAAGHAPLARIVPPARRTTTIELAETLSLPPGLHGQAPMIDMVPRDNWEARIQCTHLSRELGREHHAGEEEIDVDAMQRYLVATFPNRVVTNANEVLIVKRHAAFLSEILARTLGAEWVDLSGTELGYWSMLVPPNTCVLPFARIGRLIAHGSDEQDLVSYYLQLQLRV